MYTFSSGEISKLLDLIHDFGLANFEMGRSDPCDSNFDEASQRFFDCLTSINDLVVSHKQEV